MKDDAKNSANDQLFRIAYDMIEPEAEQNDSIKYLDAKKCWSFRVQISVEHMINTLYSTHKNDKQLVILNRFIQQMEQLEAIRHLSCHYKHDKITTFHIQ